MGRCLLAQLNCLPQHLAKPDLSTSASIHTLTLLHELDATGCRCVVYVNFHVLYLSFHYFAMHVYP